MKVHITLICFFFLSLRDGNTGLIDAEILIHTGKEGGNITVVCSFTITGGRKIFCKEKCVEQDILVETNGDRAQSGRYSIEYEKKTFPDSNILYVSITNLIKSDSGRYRCYLDRYLAPDSSREFEIRVEDVTATTSKPNWTPRPFSTSVPSASTLMKTHSLSSSSGSSTPSSASSSFEATKQTQQQQTTPAAGPGALLYVGLILVVMIIVLSAAVLIFCRKRTSKPKEPPVEMEYANVAEPDRVYDEIRGEDRQSRSPPAEISTVYSYAKPNGETETTQDNYSFVTAASSQKTTEADSSDLPYSQVDFSNNTAALVNSARCGDADKVVYSVPQVEASFDNSHAEDASLLYSTAT